MQLDLQPIWAVITVGLIFIPLEFLRPALPRPEFSWRRHLTDILHVAIGGQLVRAGTAAVIGVVLLRTGSDGRLSNLPLWHQVILVLVISDFMFWIAHRMFHAVPWLWEFHKVHHSSTHLDWLATYRVHPLDQIVNASIIALPALILGFSPLALLIYAIVYRWHAVLLHSNIDVSLGPLDRIFAMPKFHHWHHAGHSEAFDRNFGGQLAIWDRLFKTAYDANEIRPAVYGVEHAPRENYLAHIFAPILRGPSR